MRTSRKFTHALLAIFSLIMMAAAALAADPGLAYPATSEVSDQKAGSLLVYNYYTSGATSGNAQNTRINLTNTSSASSALVHLFFVADNCQVADSYICLTPNQTASFLASDVDPGVSGYIVAVAVDSDGCPTMFNWLVGDEYVKTSTGHAANLGAEAFAALSRNTEACGTTATLAFSGAAVAEGQSASYNMVPRVVAASSIPSRADGNDTLVVLNRIGGNLATGASTLGSLFGLMYDDSESVFSFSVVGGCQLRGSLSNTFPRTTPRFETIIPAGRTGWFKIWGGDGVGILGSVLNANPNAAASASAFNGGRNLHKLTLTTASYVIPVFPPSC
ncbi:MAG: hypothetical protein SF339_00590 [Blastocatellia bacterium]|nr:hypothetical protein [Blastocatellia bacterium]